MFGSMNCDCPGAILRVEVTALDPSNGTKRAVAVVAVLPRFCMMNGV